MIQQNIQPSTSLAGIQGIISTNYSEFGKPNSNLQGPDRYIQEQPNSNHIIITREKINPSNNGLNSRSIFGTGYIINQHKVYTANESNDNELIKTPTKRPIREWEGYVVEIKNDSFIAKLVNVKNNSKLPKESGKFKLSMLSLEDQNELQLGSRIRWTIDWEILPNDQRQNVSKVILLDTPEITEKVIENAYKKSAEMTKRLNQIEASS